MADAGASRALFQELATISGEDGIELESSDDAVSLFSQLVGPLQIERPESLQTPLGALVGRCERVLVSNDATILWISPENAQLILSLFWASAPQGTDGLEIDDVLASVLEMYQEAADSNIGLTVCFLRQPISRETGPGILRASAYANKRKGAELADEQQKPQKGSTLKSGKRLREH